MWNAGIILFHMTFILNEFKNVKLVEANIV